MSCFYYVEDPNGEYCSADGKRRFKRLEGRTAFYYLQTGEGRGKRFFKVDEEGLAESNIELRPEHIKEYRVYERHKQYIEDTKGQCGYQVVSLDEVVNPNDNESLTYREVIADQSPGFIETLIREEKIDLLRKALKTLSAKEMKLIQELFLSEERRTLKEIAEEKGISHVAIIKRRDKIFDKIRDFFKKTVTKSEKVWKRK